MSDATGSNEIRLRRVEGTVFRAIRPEVLAHVLDPPLADHVGRYHAAGQPALYISPRREWAARAGDFNTRADGAPRIVVALALQPAFVFDQHDEAACAALGIDREQSNSSWRESLAEGRRPPSWDTADAVRAIGADGLIDRSRQIAGGWHVVLFRWNQLGGPRISVVGNSRDSE